MRENSNFGPSDGPRPGSRPFGRGLLLRDLPFARLEMLADVLRLPGQHGHGRDPGLDFRRHREPAGVDFAAIEDTAHLEMSKAHTEKWRNWLTEEITKLGLKVTPSVANFVLIHFPAEKGKTSDEADAFLTKRGLVLRALKNYKLPHSLRMTIGTEEANRLVVESLREFLGRE